MKKILLYLVLFLIVGNLFAAGNNYGNEWINYDQLYFKIKVPTEGLYRIYKSDLDFSGVSANYTTFDPRYIQIFGREQEQYIYVAGEDDGTLDSDTSTDYIEFYANKNDGWLDSLMYPDPSGMPNPYYSLINDTIIYYLSVSTTSFGKRVTQETDLNFSGYTASPYFMKEVIQENHTKYHYGEYNSSSKIYYNPYVEGEGWTGTPVSYGSSTSYAMATENAYTLGPKSQTEFVFSGRSQPSTCSLDSSHHIQVSYFNSSLDTVFGKFHLVHKIDSFSSSDIASSSSTYKFTSITDYCTSTTSTDFLVGYIKLRYPHTYDLNNATSFTMYVPDDANTSKSYLSISNFSTSSSNPILYDLSNHKRISLNNNSGIYEALVPNSGGYKKCYISSESKIQHVVYTSIKPVSTDINHYAKFSDFSKTIGDYAIITNSKLVNEANDYKAYRNQTGYTAVVADIDELYGQFGGGIEKHPQAISRFANYIYHNWPDTVQYVFLIGKSIRSEACRNSKGSANYLSNFAVNFVPTMGYPGSDNLLMGGIGGFGTYVPGVAIGRISAETSQEVIDYLAKIEVYESTPLDEWMKNVLQFSGGSSSDEQDNIKGYTQNYQAILEDTLFGAGVFNFFKKTTDPVEATTTDSVTDLVNAGAGIISLFGHAAGTMFSFGLTYPQDYDNDDKCPLIIANSCSAGAIHDETHVSLCEQWNLYPKKGSTLFIASVTSGQTGYLNNFTNQFYKDFSSTMYGQGVGKIIKQTIIDMIDTSDAYSIGVCADMTLQGDPALNIHAQAKPDLAISAKSVFFTPSIVTSDLDSFDINIIAINMGRAFNDTFNIEVVRNFLAGTSDARVYTIPTQGVHFKDTITFTIPLDHENGIGLNSFDITLDSDDKLDELNELNNTLSVDLLVDSKDAFPIYPYKFAIIPNDTVTLKASTANVFADEKTYIFQIDTTDTYDSPFFQEYQLKQKGGVLNWTLPFKLTENVVYYWRVGPIGSLDNTTTNYNPGKKTNSDLWHESSFTYISGKRGWSQAHINQFKNDEYYGLKLNTSQRRFDFFNKNIPVELRNHGVVNNQADIDDIYFRLDGVSKDAGAITSAYTFRVGVIDSLSLEPWETSCQGEHPENSFGQIDRCGAPWYKKPPCYSFEFNNDKEKYFYSMVKDYVPDGDYFFCMLYQDKNDLKTWPDSILDYFESLGAANIRNVPSFHPYTFFIKKGNPSSAIEIYSATVQDSTFSLTTTITSNWNYGYVTTEPIGPANKWESINWQTHSQESILTDTTLFTVYGINDSTGEEEIISSLENISSDSIQSIPNLDTYIDATIYRYIKLRAFMRDDSLLSPAVLDKWQVLFEEMPEAALNPEMGTTFYADTIQEGEDMTFSVVIENTSDYNMDSLLISYYVMDKNRKKHEIEYPRLDSLRARDTLHTSISFNTIGYTGLNSLWINVNPADTNDVYDQWENYHFNNIAQKSFYVSADNQNPLLDVTFDGQHIMDGELVSAKPFIVMKLSDENQYLLLDDTSLFKVELTTPSDSTYQVYFMNGSQEVMKFTPADSSHNTFTIEYNGTFPEDGIYKLKVHATDASKNASGDFDYRISFEVINESTITYVVNYPNPFSTSTRFVFTLTGSEVPDYFKIQIMTVTGRVVREITTDEIGSIRIGNNISEYAWNGTDQFGDPLANGLYLYRVISSIGGKEIKHRSEDGLDSGNYFKKGFGKMYLMR